MDFEKIADNIYKSVEARIANATNPLLSKIADLEKQLKAVEDRQPLTGAEGKPGVDGQPGAEGKPGEKGEQGQKGADGIGLAGAMIDRDGGLVITLTNGEVKSLGQVVGKDGKDGADGLSLDSFDLEYLADSHEIAVKAVCNGRTKELRYPAGGIRPAGYWREGTKAVPGEAWVHGGSLWIAMKATEAKPATNADAWIIAARAGRDGERGATGKVHSDAPIKLSASHNPDKLVN